MPKKPLKSKDPLDRFYTHPKIAMTCTELLSDCWKYCKGPIIEPSAGAGFFLDELPDGALGLDVSPERGDIIQQDWLEYTIPEHSFVVGNPPFGSRNKLSQAFIRKALEGADLIGFILPSSYEKAPLQKVFPEQWHLVVNHPLPKDSFLLENQPYHVPCVFQVWTKLRLGLPNLREAVKPSVSTEDWSFDKGGNWFMFGASPGKIIEKTLVQATNRGYYLSIKSPQALQILRSMDWKRLAKSSCNGGAAWYTKDQIIRSYVEETENG